MERLQRFFIRSLCCVTDPESSPPNLPTEDKPQTHEKAAGTPNHAGETFFHGVRDMKMKKPTFVQIIHDPSTSRPDGLSTTGNQDSGNEANTSVVQPRIQHQIIETTIRAPYEIYHEELLKQKRGSPLWFPGPNLRLPLAYRQNGINVGDVGIIQIDEPFDFLFNIFLPAVDEINSRGVPDSFQPVGECDISEVISDERGGSVGSSSVRRSVYSEPSGLTFETSAAEGAILVLPQGSSRRSIIGLQRIKDYMTPSTVQSWYRYAKKRGRELRNGNIVVVYKCDKASSWGIATLSSTEGQTTSLTFKEANGDQPVTPTYDWVCNGTANTQMRVGPSADENGDLSGVVNNQCVFLHTLNAQLSETSWGKLEQRLGAKVDDGSHEEIQYPTFVEGSSKQSLPASAKKFQKRFIKHPSSTLNICLLENYPNARMAITTDEDWISLMTQEGALLPSQQLFEQIQQSYRICNKDGVVFLDQLSKPSRSNSSVAGFVSRYFSHFSEAEKVDKTARNALPDYRNRQGQHLTTAPSQLPRVPVFLMADESEPNATEKKGASGISGKICCHKLNGTNLVVCIDGTSNQFGEKNTNVIELYNLILKEAADKQRTWYNSGIGTYARPSSKSPKHYKNVLYHKIDLAIAWDFERTVLGAYRWLSDNYKDGDCIYLFGFSRGAYQVRVLSAMIYKVGLIHKGNEMQIPFAYELYADPSTDKPSTATAVGSLERNAITMAQRFKNTFSHKNVKVHFVGAWDTVSSIGLVRGAKMLPWTVDGMKHVCYFRHALALDERRVKFLPEYVYGGRATDPGDKTLGTNNEDSRVTQSTNPDERVSPQAKETGAVSVKKKSSPQRHQTLEVWFAGTHSDIGGGNVQNEGMDRSRPPLRWMVFEAQAVGLRMAPFNRDLSRGELIEVQESLTWPWWPLELLPIKRLSFTTKDDGKHQFTYKPHLGSTREIHPGQKIHSSLLLSNTVYNPKARPPEGDLTFWDRLRHEKDFRCQWVEFDLYEHVAHVMEDFIIDPDNTSHTLRSIAASSEGRKALYEKAIEALGRNHPPLTKCRILGTLIDAAQENSRGNPQFERSPLSEIQPMVSDLLKSKEYQKTAKEFIARFTDRCINILRGHKAQVNSVAFSPNGKLIASTSDDYTVRIWSVETWRQMHELSGHLVSAVAFFPHGRHIVSGSWDNCLWIWDVETGEQVGEPLKGHEDCITTVAVSPNGEKIASGSRDMTVRIWNVETGEQDAPFRGQTGSIQSVAFSPDGKCVASGSNDGTTWIRDLQTGKQMGKPLQAHEDLVMTVSFSLDGHHIASGSADFTIQLFDSQTGAPKRTFLGHEDVVRSVVFSPDGKRLASGSSDNTVRVWDVETGKQLGAPLQGHTGGVRSVSFSPDGNWIVSGSSDHTIRIWDAGA